MKPFLMLSSLVLPALVPAPAAAQSAFPSARIPPFASGAPFDRRVDRRLSRGSDGAVVVYDRDYQGDSAFRRDSFNDWWHSEPSRAFPRWMSNNQDCKRQWWSGGGWTC